MPLKVSWSISVIWRSSSERIFSRCLRTVASLFSDRIGRALEGAAGGREGVAAPFLRVLVGGLFSGDAALPVAGFWAGLFRADAFLAGLFLGAAREAVFFADFWAVADLVTTLLEAAFLEVGFLEVDFLEVDFAAVLAGAFWAPEAVALLPGRARIRVALAWVFLALVALCRFLAGLMGAGT